MPPRIFITATGVVCAPLDGSGLGPDPALGGRLCARVSARTRTGELRLHALARLAAERALAQVPGLAALEPDSKGVYVSSSKGAMELFDGRPPELGPGLWRFLAASPGRSLRDSLGWTGPGRNTPLACATGAYSIGLAFEDLRAGRLRAALAGAAEASLTPLILAAFGNLGALSPAQERADYRGPFDRSRAGFALGEAGAVLVLEREDSLALTGHRPVAELLGWACNNDAYHLTAPDPSGRGAARCVGGALAQAGARASEVSYVNAHGTATRAGDEAEAAALDRAFFSLGCSPRVSSVKGATGHTLGAAGALEAAVTAQALAAAQAPVNVGCRDPMPAMGGHLVLAPEPLGAGLAVSLSMGFGGHNVALVMGRP